MRLFLNKIKNFLKLQIPEAQILGELKFNPHNIPFFTVKMRGCNALVDINAEDIVNKFTDKFSQLDIKCATIAFMKYRNVLKLVNIEKNYAVFQDQKENTFHVMDLSNNLIMHHFDFNFIKAEDAFKLGIQFEKIRLEKDKKLFNLARSACPIAHLKLVKPND